MNPSGALPGLRLVTINACGLTGNKIAQLVTWLREHHFDGVIVTETKIVDDPEDLYRRIPGTGALWPGARFFHVPGSGHTGGVLVILGPNPLLESASVFNPPSSPPHDGRILRLDLTISTQEVSLLAIYAPAQPEDRDAFFSTTLLPFLPPPSASLIVGGDFNCVLSGPLDCVYTTGPPPAHNSRLIGSSSLSSSLLLPLGLLDVWRDANPNAAEFTHFSASAQSEKRRSNSRDIQIM